MFLQTPTRPLTEGYLQQTENLLRALEQAQAVVVGAGAGFSASAGLTYTGERFAALFPDFRDKYGITDMYTGGFYPYKTPEEYWAWWSRHIYVNRYEPPACGAYLDLLSLLRGRDYFVLTTNVDHQFQKAGFDKSRLFYMQGDYGLWQCAAPCHEKTYDNETAVRRMVEEQREMRVPFPLIPRCPVCGGAMAMNLRCDASFVQDGGWYRAGNRYRDFLRGHSGQRILFLELGVGGNTPGIIKYPFWKMTQENPGAVYACVNLGESFAPPPLQERAICVDADISAVLQGLLGSSSGRQE